jgi:hypothetical protein
LLSKSELFSGRELKDESTKKKKKRLLKDDCDAVF